MVSDREVVVGILRRALEVVREADVPTELEEVAFGKAVGLLAGELPPLAAATGSGGGSAADRSGSGSPRTRTAGATGSSDDKMKSISVALGVEQQLVEDTYHLDGDDIKLSISSSQLDSQVGKAAREVALLVAGARQGSGGEEWTTTSDIRAVADHYGKLNRHFAEQIDALSDAFSFSGSGRSRRVKLKQPGFEQAGALVKRLQGQEE